jgi:hypothetical protein
MVPIPNRAYYAGRTWYDPVGEMSVPALLRAGAGPQNNLDSYGRNRWGDYSLTSLDPTAPTVLWTIQEYAHGTNIWGTWIGELEYSVIPPEVYCTAKTNSLGCVPTIGSAGTASASEGNGFTVGCTQSRNNKPGVLVYGTSGRWAAAFQGGFLCAAPPIKRTRAVNSNGTAAPANDCSGMYAIDMNAFGVGGLGGSPSAALTIPGTLVNCQWWGRDPGGVFDTSLSAGLEYRIGP